MSNLKVGIVDYGLGNHGSLHNNLNALGFRCTVSDDCTVLDACDLLLLPGVGSFQPAMQAIKNKKLDLFLINEAAKHKPILGICLGMQLLARSSMENGKSVGLGLIPGDVEKLDTGIWHIGWNTAVQNKPDPLFDLAHNQDFYFNHAFVYKCADEFTACTTLVRDQHIVSVIRLRNIVGIQFHPEKSQLAGKELLRSVIEGLCYV